MQVKRPASRNLGSAVHPLRADPERLTAGYGVCFRMESTDRAVGSAQVGDRKEAGWGC